MGAHLPLQAAAATPHHPCLGSILMNVLRILRCNSALRAGELDRCWRRSQTMSTLKRPISATQPTTPPMLCRMWRVCQAAGVVSEVGGVELAGYPVWELEPVMLTLLTASVRPSSEVSVGTDRTVTRAVSATSVVIIPLGLATYSAVPQVLSQAYHVAGMSPSVIWRRAREQTAVPALWSR